MSVLSPELSALELEVATAAERHEQTHCRSIGSYTRVFHLRDFSVKYTDHPVMLQECEALRLLHHFTVKGGEDPPRVPRVMHYFHSQDSSGWG